MREAVRLLTSLATDSMHRLAEKKKHANRTVSGLVLRYERCTTFLLGFLNLGAQDMSFLNPKTDLEKSKKYHDTPDETSHGLGSRRKLHAKRMRISDDCWLRSPVIHRSSQNVLPLSFHASPANTPYPAAMGSIGVSSGGGGGIG